MLQPSSAPFTLFSSVQCSACSNNFFNDKWILQLVSTDTLVNVSVCRGEILNFSSELIMLNWLRKLLFCPHNKSNMWGVCSKEEESLRLCYRLLINFCLSV